MGRPNPTPCRWCDTAPAIGPGYPWCSADCEIRDASTRAWGFDGTHWGFERRALDVFAAARRGR